MGRLQITLYKGTQLDLFEWAKQMKKGQKKGSDWVSTAVMCQQLGCTRQHLTHLREQKILKVKVHWKNIAPYAARPTYRYHLARVVSAIDALQGDGRG